jgi:hypothetical protein
MPPSGGEPWMSLKIRDPNFSQKDRGIDHGAVLVRVPEIGEPKTLHREGNSSRVGVSIVVGKFLNRETSMSRPIS